MLLLKAFRNRSISLLWLGQATSTIGDEIYRVAFVWLAVGIIGPDTGYLSALQFAALLVMSLVAGRWADRWDPFQTMIRVDVLRGLIVLVPVVFSYFGPVGLPALVGMAVSLSAAGAFFDPALVSMVPRFAQDAESLQAANGLMGTTFRLARAVGPALVGLLTTVIPTIHFFTLDALTFFISAGSIWRLSQQGPAPERRAQARPIPSLKETLLGGYQAVRTSRTVTYHLISKSLGGGLWSLAFSLGYAFMARAIDPHNARAFGLLVASYGIGNVTGAVLLANFPRRRPTPMIHWGYLLLGTGFFAMGFAPTLPLLLAASVYTGFTGPLNDLPFLDLLQSRYSLRDIPKIFRLRMALETAVILVCFCMAPLLFRHLPAQTVVGGCGVGFMLIAVVGFLFYPEEKAG